MPNTLRTVNKYGFPLEHGDHIPFGTGSDATTTSDALQGVDVGMHRGRSGQAGNFESVTLPVVATSWLS